MTATELSLDQALNELVSAEDFLDYFAIAYDPDVVKANRMYILLRFHHYLRRQLPNLPPAAAAQRAIYRLWFERAYKDFESTYVPAQRAPGGFADGEMSRYAATARGLCERAGAH